MLWHINHRRLFNAKYNIVNLNSSFQKFSRAQVRNLNVKIVLSQTIQFGISRHFSSIWPIDLSGATTYGQIRPGRNGNDCLVSYPERLWGESYPSAEKQSVYSTVPPDWANEGVGKYIETVAASLLLYRCTPWTWTNHMEKKIDGNYLKMLRTVLNKSEKQHQLYGHLLPISQTIQLRLTRHAGNYWMRKEKLINDVLLWASTHWREKFGRPAKTNIH